MEWMADPTAWVGLGTLVLLEIVLGIDNLIFIAILVDRLPPSQRNRARVIGLSLALVMRIAMLAGISWLQTLTTPLLTIFGKGIAVRDLILIAGGLFLLVKATTELHARLEVAESTSSANRGTPAVFWQAIVQIVILDLVFSIDSVITAVGMVDHLAIMVIAVLIAIAAMMLVNGPLTRFVSAHPTNIGRGARRHHGNTSSAMGASTGAPPSMRRTASDVRERRSPRATSFTRFRVAIWFNVSIATEKAIAAYK